MIVMKLDIFVELRQSVFDLLKEHIGGLGVYHQVSMTSDNQGEIVRISLFGKELDYVTIDITENDLGDLMSVDMGIYIFRSIVHKLKEYSPYEAYERKWEEEKVTFGDWSPDLTLEILEKEDDYFKEIAGFIENNIL